MGGLEGVQVLERIGNYVCQMSASFVKAVALYISYKSEVVRVWSILIAYSGCLTCYIFICPSFKGVHFVSIKVLLSFFRGTQKGLEQVGKFIRRTLAKIIFHSRGGKGMQTGIECKLISAQMVARIRKCSELNIFILPAVSQLSYFR